MKLGDPVSSETAGPSFISKAGHILVLLGAAGVFGAAAWTLVKSGKFADTAATLSAELGRRREARLSEKEKELAQTRTRSDRDQQDIRRQKIWRFNGRVYDMVTLEPIGSARLTFLDKNNGRTFKTKTNHSGRYSIELPKLEFSGYAVEIRHPKYAIFAEDSSPSYADRERSRRMEERETLLSLTLIHVPVLPQEHAYDVRLDYVMTKP
jgi:hypothetical protein